MAEFVNGWTDAPNVIATVVSTGVLSPRAGSHHGVVFNMLGAMGGTAVAATVGKGIVEPSAMTLPAITATMLSIIAWGTIAAALGIPVSKSHALLAGLAGAGLAGGGWAALQWTGWQKVGYGLICSLGPRLLRRASHRQAGHRSGWPARGQRPPSVPSIGCSCFRRPSWPSITVSTTARSSWACSP